MQDSFERKDIPREGDLLARTLAAADQDRQTVTPDGRPTDRLAEGVVIRNVPTHADARGTVVEMFDPRWNWHPDPLVFVYSFTIRPGYAKGWGLHKLHDDRYFILKGELEVVLYDVRPDSSTCGQISRIVLSERNRFLMNIPAHVWHGERNLGSEDVVVVNFPTIQYDHASPDKYRLPLDTPLIPFRFEGVRGW